MKSTKVQTLGALEMSNLYTCVVSDAWAYVSDIFSMAQQKRWWFMVNLGIFFGFFLPCFPNLLAYSYSSSIHSLWERKLVRDSPRSERSISIIRSGFLCLPLPLFIPVFNSLSLLSGTPPERHFRVHSTCISIFVHTICLSFWAYACRNEM